ncbi:hypothetical protein M8C21_005436 [Ambrosia artemisiifolia]|uniref:SET domain-containing protein n=1 Tax=Ambrosia artemisiifolia TaxID=4212 RepID=A0AAD5CJA6_AMBAR|nr:hypothetical protein M8C21_005436 [Ambrosia artemisiifolia]
MEVVDAQFSHQISLLLEPPSPLQVKEYFHELTTTKHLHGIQVKPTNHYGKGVYADIDFEEEELVLKDQMLVGMQHSSNKIDCLVCGCCFRFIGSIEIQIGRKLYLQGLGGGPHDDCFNEKVELLMHQRLELPHSKKFPLPEVINCPGGCKEVYYCSKYCAQADWDSCHSLLCTGDGSKSISNKALSKFIQHANETNDIFILAAKAISCTILKYRKLKAACDKENQKEKNHLSDVLGNHNFSLLLKAWKPLSMGYKRRWWDCIALPDDVDVSDEASFRMQIRQLAFESLELLKAAILDEECLPSSPVEDYFLYVDDLPEAEKKEVDEITQPFLDALGEDYSVCCQGTAFYPIQSCMNHSCCPNAKAFKREEIIIKQREDKDGQATILACKPIKKGEEITISYIDEDLDLEERQALLADYGFICKCARCVEEDA